MSSALLSKAPIVSPMTRLHGGIPYFTTKLSIESVDNPEGNVLYHIDVECPVNSFIINNLVVRHEE